MTADQFADRVYCWLDESEPPAKRVTMLADQFEVSAGCVRRWASGTARPHPRLQKQVVAWIELYP